MVYCPAKVASIDRMPQYRWGHLIGILTGIQASDRKLSMIMPTRMEQLVAGRRLLTARYSARVWRRQKPDPAKNVSVARLSQLADDMVCGQYGAFLPTRQIRGLVATEVESAIGPQ
jgi:hypothetical protein